MTEQEYLNRLEQINKDFTVAKSKLIKEYAASLQIFEIGDIIKNHAYTIIIDRFGCYKMLDEVQPTYSGRELKKDLTP